MKWFSKNKVNKVVFVIMALVLIIFGVSALFQGSLIFPNFKGTPVFAPIAILIGVLLLIVSIFKSHEL